MIENLLCLGFLSLYLWFSYVFFLKRLLFTRGILSTPACDVLFYVRLKTTERDKYNSVTHVQRQQFSFTKISFESKVSSNITSKVSICL